MEERPKKSSGCLMWVGILAVLVLALGWWAIRSLHADRHRGTQARAISNCKQVVLSLKQYAVDANGRYPDEGRPEFTSANQVFRELFKEEIVTDERIFGCPFSSFNPDNEIGSAPDYKKFLMPGECHWMLMEHQSDTSHPKTPLVIENSLQSSWPPKWDVSSDASNKRGRAWAGREIIVGRNDGSVSVEKLRRDGTMDWHSPSNLDEHGKSWIDYLAPEQVAKLEYWDIEEK